MEKNSGELEFCPECGIGINNRERQSKHCDNCRASWDDEGVVLIDYHDED